MYNPYEEAMLRRRQQQMETNQPTFQQPAPMYGQPLYSGPEQAQWLPMGEDSGQMRDAGAAAGAGMASLLKRFRKPGGSPSSSTHEVGHATGNVSGFGPHFIA